MHSFLVCDIMKIGGSMIPKRIIYCWFGGKEKPQKVLDCIKTWHEKMPDWEYLEINESNFDINYNEYVKRAYESKHYAYVSDVARLWALYNYGGVYMDTDVVVYQPLDKFLDHKFFTGFESINYPVCAVMGCEKNNKTVKELLNLYNNEKFETHNNWWEYRTNTVIMSEYLRKYVNCNGEYQNNNEIVVYPRKYFTKNDDNIIDKETYAEHLMMGNWIN